MPKITAYIIAYNNETKIADAINSILWADEIILVDSHSKDKTAEIAEELGAKVVQVPFNGFGDLRNKAIKTCSNEWIFSLDSDERCTPEARDEILRIIEDPDSLDAYHMPRKNIFMGRWLKHTWTYPDYRQPQLFKKGKMKYTLDPVHEGFELLSDKPLGYLQNPIWQIPFENIEEMINKLNRYSSLGVKKLKKRGIKPSVFTAFSHSIWAFLKHYLIKKGFLDGFPGFILSLSNAEGVFYRYSKYIETNNNKTEIPNSIILRRPK